MRRGRPHEAGNIPKNNIRDLAFGQRRIGRPKNQWTTEANKTLKKHEHLEENPGSRHPNRRRNYRGKREQDGWLHLWAEDRLF